MSQFDRKLNAPDLSLLQGPSRTLVPNNVSLQTLPYVIQEYLSKFLEPAELDSLSTVVKDWMQPTRSALYSTTHRHLPVHLRSHRIERFKRLYMNLSSTYDSVLPGGSLHRSLRDSSIRTLVFGGNTMLKLINIKKFRDKVSALPNLTRLVVPRMISVANNRTLPFDMYVALEEKPIDHGTTNQALDISSVTTTEQKNDKGTGEQQKDQNKIPKKRYHVFIPPGGDLQMAVAFMNSRSAWAIGVKINSCHAGTRTYDVLAKHPFSNKIRRAKEVLLVNIDLARWLEKVSHLDNVTRLELIGCHQLSAAMSELRGLTASKLETFFLEEAPSQKPIIREQDFEIDGLMQLTASMQNLRNLRIHHPYDLVEEGSKLRRPVDFLPLNGNRVENCSIRCGSPRQRTTPIDILEFVSNCTNLRGVAFTWYNLWGYYLHRVESDLYKRDLNALKIFADQSCKVQHILVFLPTKYDDNPVDKSKIGNIHQFVADQIEETIRGSDSSLKSISVTVRGQEIFDSVELPVVVHFRVLSPSGVEQVPESAILERSDLRALGACRERTPMHPIGRVTGFCYESESMTYL